MELLITITPRSNKDLTLIMIKNKLIERFGDKVGLVVCYERGIKEGKEHYHGYIKLPSDEIIEYTEAVRKKWKRDFNKMFVGCDIYMSKQLVQDKIKAIAYTIKDGEYITNNLDWWDFVKAREISKPKQMGWKRQIDIFLNDTSLIETDKMIKELIRIHCELNIPLYAEKLARYVRLKKCKNVDDYYKNEFIETVKMLL